MTVDVQIYRELDEGVERVPEEWSLVWNGALETVGAWFEIAREIDDAIQSGELASDDKVFVSYDMYGNHTEIAAGEIAADAIERDEEG